MFSCLPFVSLEWCLVLCACSVFVFFVVVVEVIEEDVKDFILNFNVLIVNSLLNIVPGCVSLQSSLQGNQNV